MRPGDAMDHGRFLANGGRLISAKKSGCSSSDCEVRVASRRRFVRRFRIGSRLWSKFIGLIRVVDIAVMESLEVPVGLTDMGLLK